jgi:hypothetical protein
MSREEALLEAIREVAPDKAREILDRAEQIDGQVRHPPEPNSERVGPDKTIHFSEEEIEETRREVQRILDLPGPSEYVLGFFTPEELAAATRDRITHEECQRALAGIPGSLSQAVIEDREERF